MAILFHRKPIVKKPTYKSMAMPQLRIPPGSKDKDVICRISIDVYRALKEYALKNKMPDPFHITPDVVLRDVFGLKQRWEK